MQISKYIDHTNLKPEATRDDILKLCEEAIKYQFKSVCVNPIYVSFARKLLEGSGVLVCTVVGFPLGATPSCVKAFETTNAIKDGADEIDMVINIGACKAHNYDEVYEDILQVANACNGVTLKVIIETCLLTDEEKVMACKMAMKAGANFVKTSTGFSKGGATVSDVKLMKETVGDKILVKASGGIKDKDTFEAMIKAGADRIGCSQGVNIMEEYKNE